MNQKVLITGGSGLLGSYLVRWFRLKGFTHITSTYRNSADDIPPDIREGVQWKKLVLPDKAACLDIVAGHDWVIHTAALVSYQKKDRYRMLEINQTGTECMVNACLENQVAQFIYVGSIGALGRETDHVTLNEDSPWIQNHFSTFYGLSKYLGELEAWRGAGEGLHVSAVLPSVILGTGNWNKSSLQLVDRIANKLPLYPAGQTGFVDVRDVVAFIYLLLENSISGERWLLNGANLSYNELYQKISVVLGLNKKFRPAPKWLARTVLTVGNLMKGKSLGIDVIHQAYGTFFYDPAKSLTLAGFSYRKMDDTLREVGRAYLSKEKDPVLPF